MSISNFGIIFYASNPSHTIVKKLLILSASLRLCVRKSFTENRRSPASTA
ncbi:hypothetical protein H6G74_06330 [Nostoc spongiaeforme FACHB-130]|uniref:Uncharacterized protein n=1 Tax=Nostoc spongiaeforme FACHB-130 TaxID=1357510 RepID=A0ABR8FRL2_9NOSO|nr:hypothetical protein [Nostoc spongiaeforme]MBD2593946.1 hypothetical protein [Nostoc spongiaeforme FACHB-130]